MRRTRSALAVLMGAFLLIVPNSAQADHIDLSEMESFAPYNGIDAVETPRFDDINYVLPAENVTGVVIDGDARAYPIKVLVHHEIVHDVVGGVPIVVTHCPLCGVSLAYERTVNDEVLFFNVSGLLYRNNLVMADNRTGSLWPQILGEAANGTYHGTKLVLRSSTRTTWAEWQALHPSTKLLARPVRPVCFPWGCIDPGFSYDVDPYGSNYDNYYTNASTFQNRTYPDDLMHPKTFVLGLNLGGAAMAYAFPDLVRERVINDVVGGVPIVVAFGNDAAKAFRRGNPTFRPGDNMTMWSASGDVYDVRTGAGPAGSLEEIPAYWGFWFAWKDVNPRTCVYGFGCPFSSAFDWVPFATLSGGATAAAAVGTVAILRRRAK